MDQHQMINDDLKKLPATQYDIAIVNDNLNIVKNKLTILLERGTSTKCADHEERIRDIEAHENLACVEHDNRLIDLEKHKNILYGAISLLIILMPIIAVILL